MSEEAYRAAGGTIDKEEVTVGAWDTGNWDNDDALDWIPDLQDGGIVAIRRALAEASGRPGAVGCCRALAAAEIVAAAFGRAGSGLPEEAEAWVAANGGGLEGDLVALAVKAVRRVDGDSELQQLFDEAGRDESWHSVTTNLLDRLATVSSA